MRLRFSNSESECCTKKFDKREGKQKLFSMTYSISRAYTLGIMLGRSVIYIYHITYAIFTCTMSGSLGFESCND